MYIPFFVKLKYTSKYHNADLNKNKLLQCSISGLFRKFVQPFIAASVNNFIPRESDTAKKFSLSFTFFSPSLLHQLTILSQGNLTPPRNSAFHLQDAQMQLLSTEITNNAELQTRGVSHLFLCMS